MHVSHTPVENIKINLSMMYLSNTYYRIPEFYPKAILDIIPDTKAWKLVSLLKKFPVFFSMLPNH